MINEQITQITQVARLICAAQADKQDNGDSQLYLSGGWDHTVWMRLVEAGIGTGIMMAAVAIEADAMKCDGAAREERECSCGAWCEWKSITSAGAVEIVRALQEESK